MIFTVVGPVVGVLIGLISRRFRKISRHIQQAVGDITTSTEQMLKGHKEVLMFGGQQVEDKRFFTVSNRMRQQTMKMVAADAIGSPIVQMVASVALAVFLYVATIDSVKATLTAGTFTVMVTSMMMLLKPLKSLTDVNNQFQRGITACQSLFGLLDSTPEQDTGTRTLERARGEIEFRNVTFTYPTKETPALHNISFKVEAGKSVALVGRSGSGKSTIASLLTRFYDIEQGEILLDGVNIREYKLSELRKQYALVSQHVHLFNDSVANNIAYAAEDKYSREEIQHAARIAHADEFVRKMPEGYDTVIGENGASLSGGQRQRIAIARALLRDSPCCCWTRPPRPWIPSPSATSRRPSTSCARRAPPGHRPPPLHHREGGRDPVIDEGHIVERGNHDALMAQQGTYAQLRAIQFGNVTVSNKG